MNLGTLDLSMWPPALVWSLLVIVLVCHVLPDAISLSKRKPTSLRTSGTTTTGTSTPKPSITL